MKLPAQVSKLAERRLAGRLILRIWDYTSTIRSLSVHHRNGSCTHSSKTLRTSYFAAHHMSGNKRSGVRNIREITAMATVRVSPGRGLFWLFDPVLDLPSNLDNLNMLRTLPTKLPRLVA